MTSNRRIYIDIDDVLSQTTSLFPTILKQYFGKEVAFGAMTSFDLGKSFGLNTDELAEFMRIVHSREIISGFEPMEGAVEALQEFAASGYEVAVVTGRPPSVYDLTEQWLREHRIPYHQLVFVDKYDRTAPDSQYPFVVTLDELCVMNFCFAIEDSSYMAAFLSTRMEIPVALIDRPWNRQYLLSPHSRRDRVNRCLDWKAVMCVFRQRHAAFPGRGASPEREMTMKENDGHPY